MLNIHYCGSLKETKCANFNYVSSRISSTMSCQKRYQNAFIFLCNVIQFNLQHLQSHAWHRICLSAMHSLIRLVWTSVFTCFRNLHISQNEIEVAVLWPLECYLKGDKDSLETDSWPPLEGKLKTSSPPPYCTAGFFWGQKTLISECPKRGHHESYIGSKIQRPLPQSWHVGESENC